MLLHGLGVHMHARACVLGLHVHAVRWLLTVRLACMRAGGWFPIALSIIIFLISAVWHYGRQRKSDHLKEHALQLESLLRAAPAAGCAAKLSAMQPAVRRNLSAEAGSCLAIFTHFSVVAHACAWEWW
jgi:K+ transporter